jgi:hypothetical protein
MSQLVVVEAQAICALVAVQQVWVQLCLHLSSLSSLIVAGVHLAGVTM